MGRHGLETARGTEAGKYVREHCVCLHLCVCERYRHTYGYAGQGGVEDKTRKIGGGHSIYIAFH